MLEQSAKIDDEDNDNVVAEGSEHESVLLPVNAYKDSLVTAIKAHQVIIIVGETGSGKTTQIPQMCIDNVFPSLHNGRNRAVIAVTQPRRVAATTVAMRVAEERGVECGKEVGYCVRFDDRCSPSTAIKFLTDGILVRECLSDPLLSSYQVVMLDEAHERSVHTDILFGLMKRACSARPVDLTVAVF
jgi:HrpA-like RNA helicase